MSQQPAHFTRLQAASRTHSHRCSLQCGAVVTTICLAVASTRDAAAQLRIPFEDSPGRTGHERAFRGFNYTDWDEGTCFSRDNRLYAFNSNDGWKRGTFELWDLREQRKVFTFEHPHSASNRVCLDRLDFLNDGRTLAAVFDDHSPAGQIGVILFDVARREPRTSIKFAKNVRPRRVAFSPDGTSILVAQSAPVAPPKHNKAKISYDVVVYDAATGSERKRLDHCPYCSDVAFSPDGKHFASVHAHSLAKGEVLLWDAATLERRSTLHTHAGNVNLTFSPDGKSLASAVNRSTGDAAPVPGVGLWDVDRGKLRGYLPGYDGGERYGAGIYPLFAPQGGFLVASCGSERPHSLPEDAQIKLWNTTTGEQALLEQCRSLGLSRGWQLAKYFVPQLAFSPDGSMLATPDFDTPGSVKFWETKYWQPVKSLSLRASANANPLLSVVGRMEFSHDGQWFAAWAFDASASPPWKGEVVILNLADVFGEPPASRAAVDR